MPTRQSEKQNNQKSVNSVRKLGFIKSFLRVMALFYSILKCVILLLSTLSLKAKHLHLVLNITDPRHQLNRVQQASQRQSILKRRQKTPFSLFNRFSIRYVVAASIYFIGINFKLGNGGLSRGRNISHYTILYIPS